MEGIDAEILGGIKIVTLALNAPGPVAAARLRKFGAEVIKIEPPGGDALAEICPAWYDALSNGQEIIRLNLKNESERERFDGLLEKCDLMLTAMRPAALKRLALDWEQMHGRFPRLSHIEIVGCAAPYADLAGHDLTYLAALGLLSPPDLPKTLLADIACAERAVSQSLALLFSRERTGIGGYAQISLVEAASAFAEPLRYGATNSSGQLGGALPNYNLYQTSQGWLAVAALEPHFWERLQTELKLSEPTQSVLQSVFLGKSAVEWEQWAITRDLPLAAVREAETIESINR